MWLFVSLYRSISSLFFLFCFFKLVFHIFICSNTHVKMLSCYNIAICCTLFVIPALTHMTFKLLSAGWHLIKIWDLHLSGGGCCLCLYAEFVLIFYSSAGTQRVQQMFPSVPVLRGAAVWGFPQLSQDSHVSIHGPLFVRYSGTHQRIWHIKV